MTEKLAPEAPEAVGRHAYGLWKQMLESGVDVGFSVVKNEDDIVRYGVLLVAPARVDQITKLLESIPND